jgi:MFS family permease
VTGERAFTARQTIAVMIVGVVGVLIPGLQPQLLGALVVEGRASTNTLGLLATIELLAMGIAAGGAGFVLPVTRLRQIAIVAIGAAALADALTPFAANAGLFVARTIAGLAEGVLIWIAIGLIVRSAQPERWSGIYLALQTLAQLLVASLLGAVVIPAYGSAGGFRALAIVTVAGAIALVWLPRAYAPIEDSEKTQGEALPVRGVVALLGVTLYLAFIVAVWVYIEPLGLQRGVDAASVRLIAPLSLAMQVLGAGSAALLAGRAPARLIVVLALVINLALLAAMAAPPSATAFVAASALFGFLWLFVMPFQIPIVIAADPSRRAAMLIGGAQLIGSSLGPLAAAFLVSDIDVRPVLWFGAICASLGVLALTIAGGGRQTRKQQAA